MRIVPLWMRKKYDISIILFFVLVIIEYVFRFFSWDMFLLTVVPIYLALVAIILTLLNEVAGSKYKSMEFWFFRSNTFFMASYSGKYEKGIKYISLNFRMMQFAISSVKKTLSKHYKVSKQNLFHFYHIPKKLNKHVRSIFNFLLKIDISFKETKYEVFYNSFLNYFDLDDNNLYLKFEGKEMKIKLSSKERNKLFKMIMKLFNVTKKVKLDTEKHRTFFTNSYLSHLNNTEYMESILSKLDSIDKDITELNNKENYEITELIEHYSNEILDSIADIKNDIFDLVNSDLK